MNRLSDRLLALLGSEPLWTAPRLAETLGVSLRTVRRGLAQLAERGVVLDSEPGRGGGVRLAQRQGLPQLVLSQREAVTLLMGLAVAESYGAPMLGSALRSLRHKLGAVLPVQARSSLPRLRERVLIGGPASAPVLASLAPISAAALATVQEAFFSQQCLHLSYVDAKGVPSWRSIEPQYLLINAPVWYVLAWDEDKQAGRCFRLDRISKARLMDRGFARRPAKALMEAPDLYFAAL